jgi:hypothetical protein
VPVIIVRPVPIARAVRPILLVRAASLGIIAVLAPITIIVRLTLVLVLIVILVAQERVIAEQGIRVVLCIRQHMFVLLPIVGHAERQLEPVMALPVVRVGMDIVAQVVLGARVRRIVLMLT